MTSPAENTKPLQEMEKYTTRLSLSLNEMRRSGHNTDVVITCEEKEFPVHQLVLMAGCPYLKKILENDLKDSVPKRIDLSHIKENILVCILDFLYLSDPSKLANETSDDLIEIHELAQTFGVDGLSASCWEILNKIMTAENVVKVWNVGFQYLHEYYFENILEFLLKNFETIVENEVVLTLNETQMELLLRRIIDREIPMEDYLIEGIMKWLKQNEDKKKEIAELFYYFNYDLVSKECIDQILKSEEMVPRNDFLKMYLDIQVLPKLKSKSEIEEIKKLSCVLKSKHDKSSLKFFSFGYHFTIKDDVICNKLDALKILDTENADKNCLKYVPIPLDTIQLCFHSNTTFYFVRKDPKFSQLYLTGYDWEANKKNFDVRFFEHIYVLGGCFIGNNICIVGRYESKFIRKIPLVIHSYNQVNGKWKFKVIDDSSKQKDIVIAPLNVNGRLYILCRGEEKGIQSKNKTGPDLLYKSHNSYFFYTLSNDNELRFLSTKSFRVEKKYVFDNKLVTVYKKKVYAFYFEDSVCSCFVYDVVHAFWNRFEVALSESAGKPVRCCGTVNYGILFCTTDKTLLQFDCIKNTIKPFSIQIPSFEIGDNFVRKINKICCEIFTIPIDI